MKSVCNPIYSEDHIYSEEHNKRPEISVEPNTASSVWVHVKDGYSMLIKGDGEVIIDPKGKKVTVRQ